MKVRVIYLNGSTSSGKTTLARALQDELDEPFLLIGIDRIIGMMPFSVNDWTGGSSKLGFSWKKRVLPDGSVVQEIQKGPFAKKITKLLKKMVLSILEEGFSLIIDDVALRGKKEVDEWKEVLKDYAVLFVKVEAPLEVLEERERSRGNRMVGSARAQHKAVHRGVEYDIELDTSRLSIESSISAIKDALCR